MRLLYTVRNIWAISSTNFRSCPHRALLPRAPASSRLLSTKVIPDIVPRNDMSSANMPVRDFSSLATVVASNLERPSLDDREYRVITLPNQLEALLIHDPEIDKGSAALDVNVGSFADPKDLPGLAHFCEHLLFMGTEKYPQENDYNTYLSEHSGHSNAYTSTDETNYYFEVSHEYLEGALDRFAQFFIAPLFRADCKDREIRAVDSENKKNLQNDMWRLHQLDRSLSNPLHPYNKFSTGNLQTLDASPKSKGIDVREELLKFHSEHYSANLMKLVVIGRDKLDTLEQWVVDKFSAVKNKSKPPPAYASTPLTGKELNKIIYAKPVMDNKHLTLYFPVPDQRPQYGTKPANYYSHLIGHEGKGSLLQYFKKHSWASSLSAGSEHIVHGTDFFVIDVELTDKGLDNYTKVLVGVFAYLDMLRKMPAQEWIHKELKEQSEMNFRFQQKSGAASTSSNLASIMQRLDLPRNLLLSHSVLRSYAPKLIDEFVKFLSPDNFRAFLVGQSLDGLDQQEQWYGTEYAVKDIDPEFYKVLSSPPVVEELHLPQKNDFIPTNFDVAKKNILPEDRLKHPHLILRSDQMNVWHKKDDTFWIPKAYVNISLKTPIVHQSPANQVKSSVLISLINDDLVEFAYDAEIAGLRYDVSTMKEGLGVSVAGFNHKLPVLLERVLRKFKEYTVNTDRFEVIMEKHKRFYRNFGYNVPYSQVATFTHYLLSENAWSLSEKAAELEKVTPEDITLFLRELLREMQIEVLAFGNVTKEEALSMSKMVQNIIGADPLPVSQRTFARSYLLPEGSSHYYTVPLGDENNVNSVIEYIVQVGKITDCEIRARLEVLAQIAAEPAFNQLRTKEQLGYVVFGGIRSTRTTLGYRILIQSERTTDYLEERIDSFFHTLEGIIKDMSDDEFKTHVEAKIAKKLEKRKNLREENDRYWSQVLSGYYDFERHLEDVEYIKKVTKEDVLGLFQKFVSPNSRDRAKLVIHLQSQCAPVPSTGTLISESIVNLAIKNKIDSVSATEIQKIIGDIGEKDTDIVIKKTLDQVREQLGNDDAALEFVTTAERMINQCLSADTVQTKYPDGVEVDDVPQFKASMIATEAPQPRRDLSTYELGATNKL
ncbi:A-factor-processing enzyme [Trichomonascus vanleenenianus]|uniref:A-factor-processing enzyme n=1 Tax=Trichomonascus vanleenenianus TaxID=2268995 RepID=UPI003ECA713C